MLPYPFCQLTLFTSLSVETVGQRVAAEIEPRKLRWAFSGSEKPYEGEATPTGFKINRIIRYRNSFLPILIGNYTSQLGKTQIAVTMRMHAVANTFVTLWLGFFAFQFLFGSMALRLEPVGMFAFMYLMATLAFGAEARKSKIWLMQLVEAKA